MKTLQQIQQLLAASEGYGVNILTIAAAVSDTETVTIGSEVYEFDTDSDTTEGNIAVDVSASQAAGDAITALADEINAQSALVTAVEVTGGLAISQKGSRAPLACSETLVGAGNAWIETDTFGQTTGPLPGATPSLPMAASRVISAAEATATVAVFTFGQTLAGAEAFVRTSAGARRAWDGALTTSGRSVVLSSDGATDLAEDDVVTVLAWV